jgi:hypothetical protein
MDCPICFEAITAATGLVTTSCGHTYHLSCISSWYSKNDPSCPCCRTAPSATEVVVRGASRSNPDEDEDEVELTHEQLATLLRIQGGYGINFIDANVCPEVASFTRTELNSLCQGNGGCSLGFVLWDRLVLDTSATIDLEMQHNNAATRASMRDAEPIMDADVLNPEELY